MNNNNLSKEFLYQGFALILSIIVVHAFYVSLVRPEAVEIIQSEEAL